MKADETDIITPPAALYGAGVCGTPYGLIYMRRRVTINYSLVDIWKYIGPRIARYILRES